MIPTFKPVLYLLIILPYPIYLTSFKRKPAEEYALPEKKSHLTFQNTGTKIILVKNITQSSRKHVISAIRHYFPPTYRLRHIFPVPVCHPPEERLDISTHIIGKSIYPAVIKMQGVRMFRYFFNLTHKDNFSPLKVINRG